MAEPVPWLFNRQSFFARGQGVTGFPTREGKAQPAVARPRFHDGWNSVDPDLSESEIVEKVSSLFSLNSLFSGAVRTQCPPHVCRNGFQINELGE